MTANWSPPNWLWGYFIPIGLLLLTWGGLNPRKARRITSLAGFSLAITALCYWAVGFAFHMGGAQAIHPDNPALKGLGVLFTLIPDQPGWGFVGLNAFFLSGDAIGPEVYGYFLSYLPLVATSVLFISLALDEMRRWLVLLASVLAAAVVIPVALCWVWGSGWLAHLGETMGFGYGYVDFGGGSLILWIPSLMVLGILLVQKPGPTQANLPATPPTTYAPLASNFGALLMGIGWMGWTLSNPFHIAGANLYWERTALSVVLGMAGAALTSQLYAWLIVGAPEVLIAARGLTAGWAVVLVGAPFVPPWLSLILGLLSGLIFPFVHYAVESRSRLRSAAAFLTMGSIAGPIGALSVALFADGLWGQGWNNFGIGVDAAFANSAQTQLGVAGLFVTKDAAQLKAQIIGLAALGLWGLLWGAAFGLFARVVLRQGSQSIAEDDPSTSHASGTEPVVQPAAYEMAQSGAPDVIEREVLDEPMDVVSGTDQETDAASTVEAVVAEDDI